MPVNKCFTPSTFADLLVKSKNKEGFGKTALTTIDKLVLELLGVEEDDEVVSSPSLEWGNTQEWLARKVYETTYLGQVDIQTTHRYAPNRPYIAGTCDGLVGAGGGVEIKCPYNPVNHLNNIFCGEQINLYTPQIQGYIWIYNLDWIDFVSFDPRFKPELQLYVERVHRKEKYIDNLKEITTKAYELALEKVNKIKGNL